MLVVNFFVAQVSFRRHHASEASDGDEAAEPETFASETSAGAAAPRRARKQQRRPGARARVSSRRTTADATPNAAESAHWGATAVVAGGAGGIFARHRARKKPVVESEEATAQTMGCCDAVKEILYLYPSDPPM